MLVFNKNASNQSSANVDNLNVNNTANLPNFTIDSNTSTFNKPIIANSGIKLPSVVYSRTDNDYLGYQPIFFSSAGNLNLNTNLYTTNVYGITISIPGVYILNGCIDYFCYYSLLMTYLKADISTTNSLANSIASNGIKNDSNITFNINTDLCIQVTKIVTVTTSTTYNLLSTSYLNTSGLIIRTDNKSINIITTAVSQTSTTLNVISPTSQLNIGMIVTGSGIGATTFIISFTGSSITLNNSVTVAASTQLSCSISNAKSYFTATRIA